MEADAVNTMQRSPLTLPLAAVLVFDINEVPHHDSTVTRVAISARGGAHGAI